MKLLKPQIHGVIDYLLAILLWSAPALFGFTGSSGASLAYSLGWVQLGMSILTAYPLGAIRVLPFKLHGALELILGIGMIVAPALIGLAGSAQSFFVSAGIATLVFWFVSDYSAARPDTYSLLRRKKQEEKAGRPTQLVR